MEGNKKPNRRKRMERNEVELKLNKEEISLEELWQGWNPYLLCSKEVSKVKG